MSNEPTGNKRVEGSYTTSILIENPFNLPRPMSVKINRADAVQNVEQPFVQRGSPMSSFSASIRVQAWLLGKDLLTAANIHQARQAMAALCVST